MGTPARDPDGGQHWHAETYERHGRFVADLALPLLSLLAPQEGERILDLGCGDGVLTEKIAATGALVIGCDASESLLARARERGLDARHADGHALPFVDEFDAVFSNAALHWMTKPADVLAGVHRALRPNGRFVAEFGGHGNVAAIVTAVRAVLERRGIETSALRPWYFPTRDAYARLLTEHGFVVRAIESSHRPTPLPTGIEGWLATFAEPFFRTLPEPERIAARADAARLLAPALCDGDGTWTADYVRLRVAASRTT